MTVAELFAAVLANNVKVGEFSHLLLDYFSTSRIEGLQQTFARKGEDQPGLILTFNESGKLKNIERGPSLKEGDLNAIHDLIIKDIVTAGPTRVTRSIVFSSLPVRAAFKYKDQFQILPAPAEAPQPQHPGIGGQASILEYSYTSSTAAMINSTRMILRERELDLILSLLVDFNYHVMPRTLNFVWVYSPPPNTVAHLQTGYTWPNAELQDQAFSDISQIPAMPLVKTDEYYSGPKRYAAELDLPILLPEVVERFDRLEGDEQVKFMRAAYWRRQFQALNNGWTYGSQSIAFNCLVSAIETLMSPPAGAIPKCETCGKDNGPGPTQRFSDFVDKFAPNSVATEKERKKFYYLRSALLHGGKLLATDQPTFEFNTQANNERHEIVRLSEICRAVICNWLFDAGRTLRAAGH